MSVSSKSIWITGGFLLFVLVGTFAVISVARGCSSFVSYGVASDLSEYYVMINSSDLESGPKNELLTKVDTIRDKARKKSIGFFKWISYDESIRGMIEDRQISPQERELLTRELERLEREFD